LQDRFVSDPERGHNIVGYGNARNRAIEILRAKGFNDREKSLAKYGRKSRMALVTSIMTTEDGGLSNIDEIEEIHRFCRENNIIFDCDSVLKRGRGSACELCSSDEQIKKVQLQLQRIDREKYDEVWEISQSYIGTICDRYMHHLYVNQYGDVRPCIGAMDVVLGNIHVDTLETAWNSREMRIIRERKYSGKCGDECANFAEGKCNSCLGRRTKELTNESLIKQGSVETIGCWNFKQKIK
jgi:MoaA/NifB/PqqE/SkfB family radical SAM enzyme